MSAERRLRRVLALDAATSTVAAVAAAAASGPLGRLLDVPTPVVLVVAAAFVPWVVALAELSRASRAALLRFTPWVVTGNVAYVAATAVVLAAGAVDRSCWWLLVPVAAVVAELGVTQDVLRRSLAGGRSPAGSALAAG